MVLKVAFHGKFWNPLVQLLGGEVNSFVVIDCCLGHFRSGELVCIQHIFYFLLHDLEVGSYLSMMLDVGKGVFAGELVQFKVGLEVDTSKYSWNDKVHWHFCFLYKLFLQLYFALLQLDLSEIVDNACYFSFDPVFNPLILFSD